MPKAIDYSEIDYIVGVFQSDGIEFVIDGAMQKLYNRAISNDATAEQIQQASVVMLAKLEQAFHQMVDRTLSVVLYNALTD